MTTCFKGGRLISLGIGTLVVLLLLVQAVSNQAFSQPNSSLPLKDDALAGFLSFVMPGLGQLYADKPARAIFFFTTDTLMFCSSVLSLADLNVEFKKQFGLNVYLSLKRNIQTHQYISSIGLGAGYLLFRIWDVVSAIRSTRLYNTGIIQSYFERDIHVMPVVFQDYGLGTQVSIRF